MNKRWHVCGGVLMGLMIAGAGCYVMRTRHNAHNFHLPHADLTRFSPQAVEKIAAAGHKIIPIAIIGSGPAGRSAALYGGRLNFHVVGFEGRQPGGQLMGTSEVENWPGILREEGPRIMERLAHQSEQFGALFQQTSVVRLDTTQWPFELELEEGTKVYALTIILATGSTPRKLGVQGEEQYWGKGVTTCAVCDAPFFKDKVVVVVGGGDAAVEEVLQLSAYARSITLLVRGDAMRASHAMQQRLQAYPQATVKYRAQIKEIKGDGTRVTGISLVADGKADEMKVDGVFLAIGHTPNSQLVSHVVACDKMGYVQRSIPHRQATSEPGIFVAGDIADHFYRQAGVAAGDGIKAALDVVDFLRSCNLGDADLARFEQSFYDPSQEEAGTELVEITSMEQFERDVVKSEHPVVIEFYTPTCPTCKQVAPFITGALQQNKRTVHGFKVDGTKFPELMKRYEIATAPTLVVVKNGLVQGTTTKLASRKEVRAFIALFL
jgi:thioredoxin reductase (NADPH)